jgi:hypothetical protein
VLQFIATVYIWVTLHTAVKLQKSNSLLSMPAYMDKDKETDFIVLQCVHLPVRTLVGLPIHSAFAHANVGHLKVNACRYVLVVDQLL